MVMQVWGRSTVMPLRPETVEMLQTWNKSRDGSTVGSCRSSQGMGGAPSEGAGNSLGAHWEEKTATAADGRELREAHSKC